jgi:polyisoprenyl-teichoic acid--peptidoglycan teichoic acid transferase
MKPIRQWKKSTRWLVGTFGVLVLGAVVVAGVASWEVYRTLDGIYQPVERLPSAARPAATGEGNSAAPPASSGGGGGQETAVQNAQAGTETVLLLGIDRRPDEADIGRPDVIMLVALNPGKGGVTVTSIPRDTYVEIAGRNYQDKINHSYQYGLPTTIATVEGFAGVKVDHYVWFDFNGFVRAVDAVGGVEVDVDPTAAEAMEIAPGRQLLDGPNALHFARFRSDNQGDFGRNARQQQVFKAYLDRTAEVRSPAALKDLLAVVGEDVRTDFSPGDMTGLMLTWKHLSSQQVEQVRYAATTSTFGPQNLSYVLISDEERTRVSRLLQERLSIGWP